MQKYVAQPSDRLNGEFEVVRWNKLQNQYIPIEFHYPSLESAKRRASELNNDD